MSKLVSILREADLNQMSSGDSTASLVKNLETHRNQLLIWCFLISAALILVIGFGAFGMWHQLVTGSSADQIKAWSGSIGLGVSAFLLEFLRRIWVQWTRTSLVIMLIKDAPIKLATPVVHKLLDKLD